jgi:hypothetical protein
VGQVARELLDWVFAEDREESLGRAEAKRGGPIVHAGPVNQDARIVFGTFGKGG